MRNGLLWIGFVFLSFVPMMVAGCPDETGSNSNVSGNSNVSDNSNSSGNANVSDNSNVSGNSNTSGGGPGIAVEFAISTRVTTSAGTGGMDGLEVKITANKYLWNSFEEEWVLKQTFDATRTSGTIDDVAGMTAPFYFGFNLHEGESVFISATCSASGDTKELRVNFSDAKIRAGDAENIAYPYQFALIGDV